MTPEKQALRILAWLWIRHGAVQSALLHRPGRVDGPYWKEKGYTTEPLCSLAAASSRIAELERENENLRPRAAALPLEAECTKLSALVQSLDRKCAEQERALRKARECIALDRKCLFDCHENQRTGRVEDAAGLAGLAEYDEVLAVIDAAIGSASSSASPKDQGVE